MSAERLARWKWGLIFLFILLVTLPYFYAESQSGPTMQFGGFLLNPLDGNSYLAKMRQGWSGDLLFTLPYTAQPGAGTAINLYYLFLGHVARLSGASLIFVFHAARVLAALLLLLAIYRLFSNLFDEPRTRLLAFGLAAFGSGLGWMALAFGVFTPDFWVAEAYPFLAAYANPHFPLGLALQVYVLTPLAQAASLSWPRRLGFFGIGLTLALVHPFGAVLAGSLLLVLYGIQLWQRQPRRADLERLLALGLGSAPIVLYQFWIIKGHPVLRLWDAQNLTVTPPPWGLLIAFSPALLLVLYSLRELRDEFGPGVRLLAAWLLLALLLVYVPVNLQRRLLSGIYVPIAGLAALALKRLTSKGRLLLVATLVFLALPTNLIVLLSALPAAQQQDPAIYVHQSELEAFEWLQENAAEGAVVLAAPDTGLLIPAYSDLHVVYGHPYETVNAVQTRQTVESFFGVAQEAVEMQALIYDYLFYGPRERALGPLPDLSALPLELVFESPDVSIFNWER